MKIAETGKYTIEVDKPKNRVYFKIRGFWNSPADVPNYLSDWQRAIREVTSGFTILSDVREMKTPQPEVGELHHRSQAMLVTAGLRKTAELVPAGSIEKSVLQRYAKESGMTKGSFENQTEAEAWLDT